MLIKYNNYLLCHPWYYGFNFAIGQMLKHNAYSFEIHYDHMSLSLGHNDYGCFVFNFDKKNCYIVYWKNDIVNYTKRRKIEEETLNKLKKIVNYTFWLPYKLQIKLKC